MHIEKTFHSFQEYTTGNRIMYELLDKKRIHGELSQQDQDHLDELQKRIAKYLLENGNDIGDRLLKEKANATVENAANSYVNEQYKTNTFSNSENDYNGFIAGAKWREENPILTM